MARTRAVMHSRGIATVEWYEFDGRFIAEHDKGGMPDETALEFSRYDGAVEVDLTPESGGWNYVHVQLVSRHLPGINVNHGGRLGIIKDEKGRIIALTADNKEDHRG
jgi:hypothetical protein